MFPSSVALVLTAFLVRCEALTNGNLSAVNLTPKTTSTTVAPGLGSYILAALGQTPTYTNITTNTAELNTSSAVSTSSLSTPPRSTVCYSHGGRCYDDITYISPTIASTGSGAQYATSCSNAISAYNSASNSWEVKHSYTSNTTYTIGGSSWTQITYYANATTLCDGHARVNYSPAIATASTTFRTSNAPAIPSTETVSGGWMFPISSVSCSVNPSDCDGLWQAYSTASASWNAAANGTGAVDAIFPTITPSPSLPACINSSQSMSDDAFSKSFYGCGLCTIFGDEVELMYFPEATTASRDMCATTPAANLTAYGSDDGMPYTGVNPSATNSVDTPLETAVVGTRTFVRDGQAYISIKKVWAVDRCSSQIGTTITDAILALPSDKLLSLRYSQPHYQYFVTTNKVTGYPFNYADLNSPVPYSAWNGQARCEYPGDYSCNVIYENQYNPQLAMPPGIRKLDPAWEGCQMWYGGLYDPPYALKPGTAVETPTVAFGPATTTTSTAAEASSASPTTPTPTALADHTTDRASSTQGQGNNDDARQTQAVNTAGHNQNTQNTQTQNAAQNTQAPQNTQGGNQNDNGGNSQNGNNNNDNGQNSKGDQNTQGQGGQSTRGGQTQDWTQNTQGGQSQNVGQSQNGGQGVQDGQGQHWNPTQTAGQSAQGGQSNQNANTANGAQNTQSPQAQDGSSQGSSPTSAKPHIHVFTAGTFTYTATQTNSVYVCGTNTLSVGGPAATLPVNCVISAGSNGLVINTEATTITNRPSAVTALPVITKAVIVTVGTKVQTFSQDSSGIVEIGSTRLTPGGLAATLDDGSVVSAVSEGVKIGSTIARYSTVTPASAAAPNVVVFVVGTKTVTASCPPGSTNEAVIESHTLIVGGPAETLEDGSRISLAPGGAIVVDGTSAAAIATPASAIVFTVNGNTVTAYQAADASSIATIDGTVISRGGPDVTLSHGEVVTMGSNGLVVQQGSTTVPVSAFSTTSGEDGSSSSPGASGIRSGSGATSKTVAISSTRSAQQNQGSQAATTSKSGAMSIIRLSTTTKLFTTALLISPLLLAIYL
ncbi:hypothetical protein KCU65_g1895, partial [Aureobasidium melanogenum]